MTAGLVRPMFSLLAVSIPHSEGWALAIHPTQSRRLSEADIRGAAIQEARSVIDEVSAKGNRYQQRLMDCNIALKTTFADAQQFFAVAEERIARRLMVDS